MSDRDATPKAHGAESESTAGLGLISRLDDMVRDMTEGGREPRVVDWPGTIRQAATELRKIQDAPRATSAEADFDAMTWTFQIDQQCRVGGGTYALVWLRPNVELTGSRAGSSPVSPATEGSEVERRVGPLETKP